METKMFRRVCLSRARPARTIWGRWSSSTMRRDCAAGVSMIRWKVPVAGGAIVAVVALTGFYLSPATGAVGGAGPLKNSEPKIPGRDLSKRHQTYRPDNYDCEGAVFAKPGVEFRRFPQPHNFHITNRKVVRLARVCNAGTCSTQLRTVWEPTRSVNPLAPFFPPFTHFVLLLRE